MDNKRIYELNENRFNKPALKDNNLKLGKWISLGFGNFILLHCEDWATIMQINEFDSEVTKIRVHRSIINNDSLDKE